MSIKDSRSPIEVQMNTDGMKKAKNINFREDFLWNFRSFCISRSRDKAIAYCDKVKGQYFDVIRYHVDKLEVLVDDAYWMLPKYREILFLR